MATKSGTDPTRHRTFTCHEDIGIAPELLSEDDDRSQTYTPQPESLQEDRINSEDEPEDDECDSVRRLEEEHHESPEVIVVSLCSWRWIVLYTVSVLLFFLFIGGLVALRYLPQQDQHGVVVYEKDTVLIPVQPSTKWLAYVTFSVNASGCCGNLYQVPCLQLKPHSTVYEFDPSDEDQVYCLNGKSQFNITWDHNSTGYLWLFKEYSLYLDAKINSAKYSNCDSSPKNALCVYLSPQNNTAILNITINSGTKYGGQYIYVYTIGMSSPSQILINRWFYNTSDYTSIKPRRLEYDNHVTFHLHNNFQPANFSSSTDDCFLLGVDKDAWCNHNHQEGYVTLYPVRRVDILFWPVLAATITLVILIVSSIVQCYIYISRKKRIFPV